MDRAIRCWHARRHAALSRSNQSDCNERRNSRFGHAGTWLFFAACSVVTRFRDNSITCTCPGLIGGTRTEINAWSLLVVVFSYLPLNLAWVCAAASTLGAFSEQANLACNPPRRRPQMNENPYVAAVLRGFFVYLFLLSGLLLLDDTPFVNPNQGQYVRLSGFLSLSSFVVSYQPKLFNVLIVWAIHRIQAKEGDDPAHEEIAKHARRVSHAEVTHAVYNVDEHVDLPRIAEDIRGATRESLHNEAEASLRR